MRALQNKVIVEITKHNKGEVSESTGIIKLSPTALIENPNADDGMISSTHLDRYGIVRATTSDYKFRKNNSDYSLCSNHLKCDLLITANGHPSLIQKECLFY